MFYKLAVKSFSKYFAPILKRWQLHWLTGIVLMVLAASTAIAPVAAQSQAPFVQETFKNATLDPANSQYWQYGTSNDPANPPSDPPCLTAAPLQANPATTGAEVIPGCPNTTTGANPNGAPLDPNGQGVLRLTPSKTNQAAFVLYNSPIPTGRGLLIVFEFYSYNSSVPGPNGTAGDGISFFLIDGAARPTTAGGFGGSLGYAQRNNVPGIQGGYIGIGLDEYGNYSNPTEGRNGGTGFTPNAVATRGAEQAGYPYLLRVDGNTNFTLPGQLAAPTAVARDPAKRFARVTLTADNQISVDIDFSGTGNNFVNVIPLTPLSTIQPNVPLPATLKFGFASATGTFTNIHEIRNLLVTGVILTITEKHNGSFVVGQKGTYTLTVQQIASTITGPVTVTDTLPTGLNFVSATGTGWICSAVGQSVTCTYNNSFGGSGTNLPDITLTVGVTSAAGSQVINTASVSAPNDPSGGPLGFSDSDITAITPALTPPPAPPALPPPAPPPAPLD